jgi:anti-sigma B factor antagonist
MEIVISTEANATVAALIGSVDALTAPQASEALHAQIAENNVNLIVDLSQVDFISSAGLRMILGAVKEARRLGGDLRLAGGSADARKALQMSGFTTILKSYDDRAAAVASFI